MANKYNLAEDTLVQGTGRFGGSLAGEGNIAPVRTTGSMSRLDYADKISKAKQLAKEADKQTFKELGRPKHQPRDPRIDAEAAKFTDPNNMSSGSSMRGRLYNQDEFDYGMKKGGSVSSASKRADGIAVRGKTRA
jgi:hypothetical protein